MSDNFDGALTFLLTQEGLLSNDPNDKGGYTYRGIAQNRWPKWEGWPLVHASKLVEADALVPKFYRDNFWDVFPMDDLRPDVAFALFNIAVNIGAASATLVLQKSAKVQPDGIIGPATIAATADVEACDRFLVEVAKYYIGLVDFKFFGTGWLKRVIQLARAIG